MNTTSPSTPKPPASSKPVSHARETEEARREEMIAELAYRKWVKAGKPHDRFAQFWGEAEKEVGEPKKA